MNSYGRDLTLAARQAGGDERVRPLFAELLRAVGAVDGIQRVRYTSPHPKDLRPETIAAMAETPAVCEHLHLPLQSGSDRVLAAMHRGYTAERYLERLAAARAAIDDLAVTTDIIVGFPGETDDDFERTLEVAAEAAYDSAYTFIYSPRPGTEAAERVDELRAGRRRGRALRAAARSSSSAPALAKHEARVGRIEEVARRGPVAARTPPSSPAAPARTSSSTSPPTPIRPGSYATVAVTGAAPHHLRGELVERHPARRPQDAAAPARRLITITEEPYDSPVAAALVQALLRRPQRALRRRRVDGQRRRARRRRLPRRGHARAWCGRPMGTFLVAWLDGEPVGCGAVKPLDSDPDHRRDQAHVHRARGAPARASAARCSSRLEARAAELGYRRLQLETGLAQPEAIALYESHGWHRITPYGHYKDSPQSVCFAKALDPRDMTRPRRPRRRHRVREVGARPGARPARPDLGARVGRLDAGVPGHGHRHGQADRRPSGPRCRTTSSTCSTRGRTAPSPGSSSEARAAHRRHRGARAPGAARRRHRPLPAGRRRRPRHPGPVPEVRAELEAEPDTARAPRAARRARPASPPAAWSRPTAAGSSGPSR